MNKIEFLAKGTEKKREEKGTVLTSTYFIVGP